MILPRDPSAAMTTSPRRVALVGALAFPASDAAAFITGQVLNVDGGGFGF